MGRVSDWEAQRTEGSLGEESIVPGVDEKYGTKVRGLGDRVSNWEFILYVVQSH